jgi:hypothetical protein
MATTVLERPVSSYDRVRFGKVKKIKVGVNQKGHLVIPVKYKNERSIKLWMEDDE